MVQNFNKRYVVRFALICIGLFIISAFLPVPGMFNLLVAGGTAFYVGRLFSKDHNRVPEAKEQNQFAMLAFFALMGIVAIMTSLIFIGMPPEAQDAFTQPFREKSLSIMIIGTLLAIVMMWGCIHFGFGLGGRLYMKKLAKQNPTGAA